MRRLLFFILLPALLSAAEGEKCSTPAHRSPSLGWYPDVALYIHPYSLIVQNALAKSGIGTPYELIATGDLKLLRITDRKNTPLIDLGVRGRWHQLIFSAKEGESTEN